MVGELFINGVRSAIRIRVGIHQVGFLTKPDKGLKYRDVSTSHRSYSTKSNESRVRSLLAKKVGK